MTNAELYSIVSSVLCVHVIQMIPSRMKASGLASASGLLVAMNKLKQIQVFSEAGIDCTLIGLMKHSIMVDDYWTVGIEVVHHALLGTSMIDALLKHMGLSDHQNERLKVPLNTLATWPAQVFSTELGMTAWPDVLYGITLLKDALMSASVNEITRLLGCGDLDSWVIVLPFKACIKGIELIWK